MANGSMFDWKTERNLAQDGICPGLYVSTGVVATYPRSGSRMTCIETWIFSDLPEQRSRQIVTQPNTPENCMRVHRHIVANLRKRFCPHCKGTGYLDETVPYGDDRLPLPCTYHDEEHKQR